MHENEVDDLVKSLLSTSRDVAVQSYRRCLWSSDDHFSILDRLEHFLDEITPEGMLPVLRLGCFLRTALTEPRLSGISKEFSNELLNVITSYFSTQPLHTPGIEEASMRAYWGVICESDDAASDILIKEMPPERQYSPEYMSTPGNENMLLVKTFLAALEREFATRDVQKIVEWYRKKETPTLHPANEEAPPSNGTVDIFDDLF